MDTTRTGWAASIGVARLVRARHGASRTVTMPSGATRDTDVPSSPTIHSRPMVGVEKRVRTMPGIPATMATAIPAMATSRVIHESDRPS